MMLDDGTLRGGVVSCGVRADDSRGENRDDVKEYEIYRRADLPQVAAAFEFAGEIIHRRAKNSMAHSHFSFV
jgi:hypothetical protein